MKSLFLTGLLVVLLSCDSQNNSGMIKFNDVSSRGYSQSVEFDTENTKMIFISGQVPVNSNGEIVGKGDLEAQTEQVFKNIKAQIEKSGGTMADIVNIDCYFTDISKISEFRTARDKYINLEAPPASTAAQVERLIHEDFLIEINATAIVEK